MWSCKTTWAWFYSRQARFQGRSANFKPRCKRLPDNAALHDNLGLALEQAGQASDALDQFQIALRIDPNSAKARDNLAKLQAHQQTAPAKK